MRMKIKRIEKLNKAIERYDQLIDETERKKFIQKVKTVVNIGTSLLLLSCTVITANEVAYANILSLTKTILLTIATTLSTGGIYVNTRGIQALNDDIRKYKKIKKVLISGDEKLQRSFLEDEYPGLYDNIVDVYENNKYYNQNSINYNRGVRTSGR